MSKIEWHKPGTRYYDHGLDRGVLYPYDGPSVPWNGLVSVEETPSGGDVNQYYVDGVNYHNDPQTSDFKATLQALTYPDEFEEMQGSADLGKGFLIGEQPRKYFGLSYRTRVGNDTYGDTYSYKLHILNACVATPTTRINRTSGNDDEIEPFSWDIFGTPQKISGYKAATHFSLDSRKAGPYAISELERILYGTDNEEPRLPTSEELLDINENIGVLHVVLNDGDFPTFTIHAMDEALTVNENDYTVSWPSVVHPFNGDSELFQISSL